MNFNLLKKFRLLLAIAEDEDLTNESFKELLIHIDNLLDKEYNYVEIEEQPFSSISNLTKDFLKKHYDIGDQDIERINNVPNHILGAKNEDVYVLFEIYSKHLTWTIDNYLPSIYIIHLFKNAGEKEEFRKVSFVGTKPEALKKSKKLQQFYECEYAQIRKKVYGVWNSILF